MDRERLSRLLEEPAKVAREDIAGLKALAEKYPWFSGAQLLLAVGEQASGDVLADGALGNAGAHLPSRSVLFDLQHVGLAEAAAELKAGMAEAKTEKKADAEQKAPPAEAVPAPATPTGTSPVPTADELDRQIIEAALASAYDLTLHSPPPASAVTALTEAEGPETKQGPLVEEPEAQDEGSGMPVAVEEIPGTPAAEEVNSISTQADLAEEELDEQPEQIALASQIKVTAGTRLRFTDWLTASTLPIQEAPGPDTASPALAPVPSPYGSEETLDLKLKTRPAREEVKALIDRFIEQETPAPIRKAEFYTPQSAAKKSLDDSAGMVSETLARIYEKQGNTQKAIEAYRKLALKYPEKSAYFAALSKELENRSNP